MSYLLQIFDSDDIRTTGAAAALLYSSAVRPPPAGAFERFRAELESTWPGVGRDPAWPEGLDPPPNGDAIWGLALDPSKLSDNLLRHLGYAAARAGLYVLDPQAGILLRRDGVVVNLDGRERALGAPTPWCAENPAAVGLNEEQTRRWVADAAAQRFERSGFAFVEDGQWLQFVRHVGDVQQCIELTVAESGRNKGTMSLHLGLRFFCPRVRNVWIDHFQQRVAEHVGGERRRPPPELTLWADQVEDVPNVLSEALGGRRFTFAATREQINAWVDSVAQWFDSIGDTVLERTTSIPGLAHYVLHPQQLRWLYLNHNLSIDEILSRLTIVGAFQRDRLVEWADAFRDHRRRKGRDPTFGKDAFVPNRSAVFEEWIAYAGTEAFARAALGLKS